MARDLGVSYFECSAASGIQVEDAFHHVIRQALAARSKAKRDDADDDDDDRDERSDKEESLSTKFSRRKSMLMNAMRKKKNSKEEKQGNATGSGSGSGSEGRSRSETSGSSSMNGFSSCPSAFQTTSSLSPPSDSRPKYGSIIKLHQAEKGREEKCC